MNKFCLCSVIGITIYFGLFFASAFEPYHAADAPTPSRASFFSYLLLPDAYFEAWYGPFAAVSLADRLPILGYTLLCLLAAAGFGHLILFLLQQQKRIDTLEYWLFAVVLGLGFVSAYLFWGYFLGNFLPTPPHLCSKIIVATGIPATFVFRFTFQQLKQLPPSSIFHFQFSILSIFATLTLLGGMIPSTDYDVLSYHLAGAREIFEAGKIEFLPHNVYANMPFGAEMFAVWGMALTGDAFTGAMVGKTLISVTSILTALGIFAFCRRFVSVTAGLWGMILYISTPWIVYVSSAGLIDTVVGMYAFFAIYAAIIMKSPFCERRLNVRMCFLAGFVAGCAAACKYPAVLFVVLPLAAMLVWPLTSRRNVLHLFIFSLGVLLACGGWYYKNWYFTGNPVYPLCDSIFGDATHSWSQAVELRWREATAPHGFGLTQLGHDIISVTLTSPWNSPLVFPLALISLLFLKKEQRKIVGPLWCWLGFFFAGWWLVTHRIDRFWLPALPVLCVLAGLGIEEAGNKEQDTGSSSKTTEWQSRCWPYFLTAFLAVGLIYNFLVSGAPAPGKLNRYFASLESMRNDVHVTAPWSVWFNRNPPDGKILLVGDARAFLYDVPVLYHTCWNETPLKEIIASNSVTEIREEFRRRGIAFVLVDWAEIRRFRSPGNYGFSEFVQPEVFDKLVADGILERFCPRKELADSSMIVYRVQ